MILAPTQPSTIARPFLPELSGGDDRLRIIVAAAAPFPDRASGEHFVPTGDDDRTAASVAAWIARAAPDPANAVALRAHLDDTGRRLDLGLRPVALRDADVLPEWARSLAGFLRAQPPRSGARTTVAGALAGSFQLAADALRERVNPDGGIAVTDEAWSAITTTLVQQLVQVCNLSFCHELQRVTGRRNATDWDQQAGLDASQDGWLDRLSVLPGLAYVIGVTCLHWRLVQAELFGRLGADMSLLQERLWGGAGPGPLVGFRGDAGDRHGGGHSVALLEFAGGLGVVYKPKDMRHAEAFQQLTGFLNGLGLPLDLPVHAVLVRDGYGWEELIETGPCADTGGFPRFYQRFGQLIRLVQLLEGRDMWADNLLAAGENPVIIDLECLLYPRVQAPPALPEHHRGLLSVLETSVVRTAMAVQPWVPSKDRPVVDIGCLSHAGDLIDANGDPVLPLPPYRPTHAGLTADPWDYWPEVVTGYRQMHMALCAAGPALAEPDGPLGAFRDVWVRYIWRHTWDGYKILRASVSPLALTDGATRETVLAGVLRGAVARKADGTARADILDIVLAEIESFRQLDIPLFRATTTGTAAVAITGEVIADHFQGTAWQRLAERVAGLPTFDLDGHVAVLTACLDAARAGTATRPAAGLVPGATGAAPPLDAAALTAATQIGDLILDARHHTETGAGWIGLSWYPMTALRQVEILSIDLVSGFGGPAVFLAELWAATGDDRYRQCCRDALAVGVRLVGESVAFATDTRLAGGAPVPGGFAGPGALIHALARCGTLLGDGDLVIQARALVAGALSVAASGTCYADVPFGTAGLLLNLLRLRGATADRHAATEEGIAALSAAALADLIEPGRYPPQPARAELAQFVPTGADSVVMALARTLAEAPELVARPGPAYQVIGAHRFDPTTVGGRLASADTAASLNRAVPWLGSEPAAWSATPLSDRALICATGVAVAGGPAHRGEAEQLLTALLARRAESGSWYGDRCVDDQVNLGALDGVTAVGLLLLQLRDANVHPLTVLR